MSLVLTLLIVFVCLLLWTAFTGKRDLAILFGCGTLVCAVLLAVGVAGPRLL